MQCLLVSQNCFFWLIVGLLFATWLMCFAYLIFSPLFTLFLFFLWIFITMFLCMCVRTCVFRKRQWCHWAPTHKLSALDTQRRMLSLMHPTQRTVRPSTTFSLCNSFSMWITHIFLFQFLLPQQLNQTESFPDLLDMLCLEKRRLYNILQDKGQTLQNHSMNIIFVLFFGNAELGNCFVKSCTCLLWW